MAYNRSATTSIHTEGNNTNIAHNNREEEEVKKEKNKHIDQDRIKDNVVLLQKPIRDLYDDEFSEALENYNSKQRRKDRRIPDYYDHIKNSKKTHEQREMIIQVGSFEDIESGNLSPEEARDILIEYYDDFPDRNPNLKLYNVVIHMDESTPHMHMNFVPVASGYKQGLEKQVGFDRALKEQDSSYSDIKPFADWRAEEDQILEGLLNARGIEKKEAKPYYSTRTDFFKEIKERERSVVIREEALKIAQKSIDIQKANLERDREMFNKDAVNIRNEFKSAEENIKNMIDNAHIPEVGRRLKDMQDKPRFKLKDSKSQTLTDEDIKDLADEDSLKL